MLARFQRSVSRVFDQNVYSTRLRAFYSPLLGFLPSIGLAVVLFVGGREVIDGSLTLGEFTAFYTYLLMLIGPDAHARHGAGDGAAGRGIGQPAVRDPRPRAADRERAGRAAAARRAGRGRVPRRHPPLRGAAEPALEGVDRCDGASRDDRGAGRARRAPARRAWWRCWRGSTTRATGAVSIDGADVREVDVESLRGQIAFVADESFLFSASVAENIAYARPEATQRGDRAGGAARAGARIHRAAARRLRHGRRRARADPLGRAAPAGGDRPRAARRSADPDPRRRHLVGRRAHGGRDQARPQRGDGGRTTFVVAHRLSTISLADEIVVIDEGRIVDRGTHEELLERCPLYARDRRARARRRGLPAARPRGARGGGAAVSRTAARDESGGQEDGRDRKS